MHFSINRVHIYQFKQPSFWFAWCVQKPFIVRVLQTMRVGSLIAAAATYFQSVLAATGLQASMKLESLFTILVFLFFAWFLSKIITSINKSRESITNGSRRSCYVTNDDYSFQMMFVNGILKHGSLPNNVLNDMFTDRSLAQADKILRQLDCQKPEHVELYWQHKMRILNLIQATYVRAQLLNDEVMGQLSIHRKLVNTTTNHVAIDLLRKTDDSRQQLMDIIERVRQQA
ncbi:MAG: hypothetical protein EOT05_03030 [Candidatus Microsaccharimonas sossegonensis]|uniref:Uncharacterized protein n=1 Tax=Candidatus Microsaccharimonas sossegonensis TaxID=2506948 RepID=A0A4Q0AI37_9BACT|nr:MAG: hypothetical protein EOT05_03030 [Candidatus Microsaccharimonas sossegonensis]